MVNTRLDGETQDARTLSLQWPGLEVLAADAAGSSRELVDAAEAMDDDRDVVLAYMGKSHRYPRSFFLVHAAEHGVEHRARIGMMLVRLGEEAPDLDGWAFASAAGLGEEV